MANGISEVVIVDDPGGTTRYVQVDLYLDTGEVERRRIMATGDVMEYIGLIDLEDDVVLAYEIGEQEAYEERFVAGADPLTMPEPTHFFTTVEDQKRKIWRRFLRRAYQERDPWLFRRLIPFVQWLIAQYGVPAIKANLNLSDAAWSKLVTRYQHIKDNLAAFESDTSGDIDA